MSDIQILFPGRFVSSMDLRPIRTVKIQFISRLRLCALFPLPGVFGKRCHMHPHCIPLFFFLPVDADHLRIRPFFRFHRLTGNKKNKSGYKQAKQKFHSSPDALPFFIFFHKIFSSPMLHRPSSSNIRADRPGLTSSGTDDSSSTAPVLLFPVKNKESLTEDGQ